MKKSGKSFFMEECVNINDLPENEELDYWPVKKGHKCKVLKDNEGTWRIIDLGIADLIQALWDKGYETLFCCEGHEDENHCKIGGYISFKHNPKNLELVEKIEGNDIVRIKKEKVNHKTGGRYVIRFYPIIPNDTTEFKQEFIKQIMKWL